MPLNETPVSSLIAQAFAIAMRKYNAEATVMTQLSHRMAARCLVPVASADIQRQSHLDLVLRCMEDEQAARAAGSLPKGNMMTFHYQKLFSDMWIGGWYEILRALRQRADEALRRGESTCGFEASEEFKSLLADLERLRMPLEKYEIAKDRSMSGPLTMTRYPPNNDETDNYVYDPNDPRRDHIMPTGISSRGSVMWLALDHTSDRQYWIERRELSERLLALANHPTMK
jgi:hypothetical protein